MPVAIGLTLPLLLTDLLADLAAKFPGTRGTLPESPYSTSKFVGLDDSHTLHQPLHLGIRCEADQSFAANIGAFCHAIVCAPSLAWAISPSDRGLELSFGTERGGIRTLVKVTPKQHFQCCAFNHSAISPKARVALTGVLC